MYRGLRYSLVRDLSLYYTEQYCRYWATPPEPCGRRAVIISSYSLSPKQPLLALPCRNRIIPALLWGFQLIWALHQEQERTVRSSITTSSFSAVLHVALILFQTSKTVTSIWLGYQILYEEEIPRCELLTGFQRYLVSNWIPKLLLSIVCIHFNAQ